MGFVSTRITATDFVGSLEGTATTSSISLDSKLLNGLSPVSFINTGSTGAEQALTGSLTVNGNLTVLQTASFAYVTASQTIVDQNTITTFAYSPNQPTGGYIVADSSSLNNSSSLLYNVVDEIWIIDKPLSASLFQGTASYAQATIGYTHNQTSSDSTWQVTHSLEQLYPSVTVWMGTEVVAPDTIIRTSPNDLTITFTQPITGSARIL
jgi:hypothetical protein